MSCSAPLFSALALRVFWLLCVAAAVPAAHSLEPTLSMKESGEADASLATANAIALMNERLSQLEFENKKLRDRLGFSEETTVQQTDAPDDARGLAGIFTDLAAELLLLGPDLIFELAALLLIGGLVLLVTKGLSPPAFIAGKATAMKAREEKRAHTYTKEELLQVRAAVKSKLANPAAVLSVAEPVNAVASSMATAPAVDSSDSVAESPSEGLEHPAPCVEEEPSAASAEVPPFHGKDSDTKCSAIQGCIDPGVPPGLEHMAPAPLKEDAPKQHADDHATDEGEKLLPQEDEAALDPAEMPCDVEDGADLLETSQEGNAAVLPEAVEHPTAASGSEPEAEPKASQTSSSQEVKIDSSSVTKQVSKTRTKKTRQSLKLAAEVIAGDVNELDEPDEFLPLPSGKSEGSAQRHERPHTKKKGRNRQQRSEVQKRSSEDANVGRQRWSCRWPCSWQLTLAVGVMLGIILVGKTPYGVIGPYATGRAQAQENLHELKAKRNQMARQLALMKLEQIHQEALVTAASLPDGKDTSLLEGASNDAKQLLNALRDVPDADFPVVEKDVDKMMATWKTRIVAAKSRVEPGGAPQCAANNEE